MSEFILKTSKFIVAVGCLMAISACSEHTTENQVSASSTFNYAIDDKIQTEQVIVMLFDIHVGKDGQVIEVKLAEGQADQGIFTEAAIRKIKQREFAIRMVDGVAQSYWQRNQPVEAGSVLPVND